MHDGEISEGTTILTGVVNELPRAARQLGITLDAIIFLPESLMASDLGQLSPVVARGLLPHCIVSF